MQINNVILTKHNLKEMVKSWESELSLSMGYLSQITTNDSKSFYPYNVAIKKLQNLKMRMNNIING